MAIFTLSLSDLLLIDEFPKVFSLDDKEKVEKFLFENGMDITKPYETEVVTHRNLQNNVVTCLRYVGEERTCRVWRDTGCASLAAWIESTGDFSFREEMRFMSREQNKSAEREFDSKNYTKE